MSWLFKICFVFLNAFLLVLYGDSIFNSLDRISKKGNLKVILQEEEPFFYQELGMQKGIHYDLARLFAQELGVVVEFVRIKKINEVSHLLKTGQADMALVGRITKSSQERLFSRPYLYTSQMVACRRGGDIPKRETAPEQIQLTIPSRSYAQEDATPALWSVTDASPYELFEQLSSKKSGCLLVNETDFLTFRRYFPQIKEVQMLPKKQGISAEFPQHAKVLKDKFDQWLVLNAQWVQSLEKTYYDRFHELTYSDLIIFHYRVTNRLPKFLKYFKEAGRRHQLPWQLLAAQAYQESHWNPRSRSKTGVRGMMMLTKPVAKELNVNRLDPVQSIFGGTRYLKQLIARVPSNVSEQDKMWFALAAYNVGMGHVRDAQKLTESKQQDPGDWQTVRAILPKLALRKYYKKLRYGYARGYEAVHYVRRIREFYAIILRFPNTQTLSLQRL